MEKRLLVLIFLFFLPLVSGFDITFNYTNYNSSYGVDVFIYNCTSYPDNICNNLGNNFWNNITHTDSNSLTISNTTNIANKSLEFHYTSCEVIVDKLRNLSSYAISPITVFFDKYSNCTSNITFTSEISGGNVNIRVNLSRTTEGPTNRGIFPFFLASSASLPSIVHDFYNIEVNLSLYINGTFNQSKKVVVPVEGANADFALALAPGSYNITVKSNVTDCKCSSSVVKEASQIVTIESAGGGAVNYTLTVSVNPQEGGSVIVNDTACISSVGCPAGTYVLLSAVANANYSFANWSGNASGTSNPLTIVMDSNKNIVANFVGGGGGAGGGGGGGAGGGAGGGVQCPEPSAWSECKLNISGGYSQNRTNYNASSNCSAYIEIRACNPLATCAADGFCKLGCAGGDPDCNCTLQGGRICVGNLTCPNNYELKAIENGCCATQCREYCPIEGQEEYCLPGSDRCALQRKCVNHIWTGCVKLDPTCIKGNACIDGTPSGQCSWKTSGLYCENGNLKYKSECVNFSLQIGGAGIPSIPSAIPAENITIELSPTLKAILRNAKYAGISLLVVMTLVIIAYVVMKRRSKVEFKMVEEEKPRPIKPSELLLSVIESLSMNEKKVCEVLLSGDGIRQQALLEETGLTKQQLEKALTSLEEKQIIKPRASEPNPRIWFNENLL
ncbi:MAG: hypothetical protein QW244_00600 [Candidatus Pacearchaeota archaeon]